MVVRDLRFALGLVALISSGCRPDVSTIPADATWSSFKPLITEDYGAPQQAQNVVVPEGVENALATSQGGDIIVNGANHGGSARVNAGDLLTLEVIAPWSYGRSKSAEISVGNWTGHFEVTTPYYCQQHIGTAQTGFPTTAFGKNPGQTLPDFGCLRDEQGKEYNLNKFLSNVTLLVWGAGWEPAEQRFATTLNEVYAKHHGAGFEIVQMFFEGGDHLAPPDAEFLNTWAGVYDAQHVLLGDPGILARIARTEESASIPAVVLLDRDGVIVYSKTGAISVASLDAVVQEALDRGPGVLPY